MKRYILVLALLLLSAQAVFHAPALRAEEEVRPLAFWGIDLKDFHAGTPRPVSVPGAGGVLDYYWYWPFQFKYVTDLQELKKYYEEMIRKMENSANTDESDMLKKNIERLDATIKHIDRTSLYMSLYTDSGQMLTDTANGVIRNLAEKEVGRKLYTCTEVADLNLNEIPETADPDYGLGKWVYGVAIFKNLPANAREFEIRVTGLGKRFLPMFMPGRLFYPADTLDISKSVRPTMRRNLRYFYRKIGQSEELSMTNIEFESRKTEWIWSWSMQIYVGRFREVNIKRASGLKRRYVYAPYYICNDTHLPQTITVEKAGFCEDIVWGGEKLPLMMLDDGNQDERWKPQVMDNIRQRLDGGEEKEFSQKYETYPVQYSAVDMEQYYKEKFNLDYIPDGTPEEQASLRDKLKNSDLVNKLSEDLEKRKGEDVTRKLKFLPEGDAPRLFSGTIESGKIVAGLFIVRWGVEDINQAVDQLIVKLQSQALAGMPADNQPLLAEYLKLLKPAVNPNAIWTRPADPARDVVLKMLLDRANADLKEKSVEVSEDDVQRYGTLAPLGALFNQLAWERLNERAEKSGATDSFFAVKTGSNQNTGEMATISSRFQRFLPPERAPLAPIPDDFKNEGTRAGISKGARSTKPAAGGEEKPGEGAAGATTTNGGAQDIW